MELLVLSLFFVFGSMVGSFLNVVIVRMPRDESIVTPRSKCPSCGTLVKWYQNIPIVSWIVLRGKCAKCSSPIQWLYPIVELITGGIAVLLAPSSFEPAAIFGFAFYFSVASVFLAHFVIDVRHQILPDKLNIYLLLISLPYVTLTYNWQYWLTGGVIGFFGPYLVTVAFYKLRGVIGLGGGDIKLFGILGLILGPIGILNNIFLSCMLGSIVGTVLILLKKMDRNSPFAFGPFIIIAAALQIFFPSVVELINPLYLK